MSRRLVVSATFAVISLGQVVVLLSAIQQDPASPSPLWWAVLSPLLFSVSSYGLVRSRAWAWRTSVLLLIGFLALISDFYRKMIAESGEELPAVVGGLGVIFILSAGLLGFLDDLGTREACLGPTPAAWSWVARVSVALKRLGQVVCVAGTVMLVWTSLH